MPINNKHVLASVIVVASSCGVAQGQESIEFTVVHDSPPSHVTVVQGIEPWMSCVDEGTQGQVTFRTYPGGQLASNKEMLNAVNSGIADLAPVPIGYVSDKMPLNTVGMLPGLGGSSQELVNAYSQAIEAGPLAQEFSANDIVPLWVKLDPPYQVASATGPLRTLDDFSGKVLRSSGGALNLSIEALGASPAEISVGDTYMSLERGTVDGALTFLTSMKAYNMDEVTNALSSNAALGSFPLVFAIRDDKWDSLPPETQQVMSQCGAQTQASFSKHTDEQNEILAEEFSENGVEVYEFTSDELEAMNERLVTVQDDWVERLSRRGLAAEEVLKNFKELLKQEK